METVDIIGTVFSFIFSFTFLIIVIGFFCCLPVVKLILHKLNFIRFNRNFEPKFPILEKRLKVGETESYDFRTKKKKFCDGENIRIASYNIEDGKRIDGIIKDISKFNPDILLLQEVDVFSKKVSLNTGKEIASALEMNYYNTCTKLTGKGYQGNAILTKFDIVENGSFQYICAMYDNCMKQNHGLHSSPAPFVEISKDRFYIQPVSVHLDAIYAGRKRRREQMVNLLEKVDNFEAPNSIDEEAKVIQIIGGDLNTISTGIGRFCYLISPDYSSIFENFGTSEAEEMEEIVIKNSRFFDPFKKHSWCSITKETSEDATMSVYGLFSAKVDWLLFPKDESLEIVKRGIFQGSSDHMLVYCDVHVEIEI